MVAEQPAKGKPVAIARASLSGSPRTGTLQLPAPRAGDWTLRLENDGGTWKLHALRDTVHRATAALLHVMPAPDQDEGLHGVIRIDGYDWRVWIARASGVLVCELYDDLTQPFRGPYAAVDEHGIPVAPPNEPKTRRRRAA